MKKHFIKKLYCTFALLVFSFIAGGEEQEDIQSDLKLKLVGEWQVSLYYSPTSPPSSTQMTITKVNDDGTLEGDFYQTSFQTARYTFYENTLIFALITSDNSGLYSTSGRMTIEGDIEGQTLSEGRNFLMAWSANKN
ncbi:hypothetical protein [Alteromonas facilis]|uniref:hypothetical protein n=1 Tax=Alteromonas facilis TaxID=2048004 RepID=UPI000C28473F|nr:hypothetical protein [Alteromonas facilis]